MHILAQQELDVLLLAGNRGAEVTKEMLVHCVPPLWAPLAGLDCLHVLLVSGLVLSSGSSFPKGSSSSSGSVSVVTIVHRHTASQSVQLIRCC